MTITMRSRVVAPGAMLYDQNFATDRSADFGGAVTHDPTFVFSSADSKAGSMAGYLYAQSTGAMVVGAGSSGSISGWLDIPVKRGDRPTVYVLLFHASGIACDTSYTWRDGSGALISTAASTPNTNHLVEKDDLGPAPADGFLRINWLKKNSGTTGVRICAVVCQNSIGFLPANFKKNRTDGATPYKPELGPALVAVGSPYTIDASSVLLNADSVQVSGSDKTVSGTSFTITATAPYDSGPPSYHPVPYTFAGVSRGHRSNASMTLYAKAINPITFEKIPAIAAKWVPDYFVEVNRWFVIDFIGRVQGGLYPYTATIVSSPAWLKEGIPNSGLLRGKAPSSGQSRAAITVDVTDSLGQTIRFSETITVVATRSRTPNRTLTGGTIGSPVNIMTAANLASAPTNAPYVVQLGAGHFSMGSWSYFQRPNNAPVIIRGNGVGAGTTVAPGGTTACSGVIFENIEWITPNAPATPENLGSRESYSLKFNSNESTAVSPGHIFVYNCTSKGFKSANLSLETSMNAWCYRVSQQTGFVGTVLYSSNPSADTRPEYVNSILPDHATVQSSWPAAFAEFGHGYYNGGYAVSQPMVMENCHVEQANMAYAVYCPHSVALIDCTAKDIRTDVLRTGHGGGYFLKGFKTPERSHWGNHGTSEHRDMFQTVITGGNPTTPEPISNIYPCPKRIEVRDSLFLGNNGVTHGPLVQQGLQVNTSPGATSRHDPRIFFRDIWFFDTVFSVSGINVATPVIGDFHFRRCWLTANYDFNSNMIGVASVRANAGGYLDVEDSIVVHVRPAPGGDVEPRDVGNLLISNLTPSTVMPDIANTALTLLERYRIDPAWAAANPGKGPQWLVSP